MPDKIIIAEDENEELKYKATDKDEEEFFIMYHMGQSLSVIQTFTEDYRKWIIARFLMQKHAERDMYDKQKLRSHIVT